jgi:uncharacterized protein YifE (UPF0438 family)
MYLICYFSYLLVDHTHQLPYVEKYYVCFDDYIRDDEGCSILEEKKKLMNYGNVLLGIDEVDIEGKQLQDIKYMILCRSNNMVQLTFFNKNWFNYDRHSVRVTTEKR